MLILSRKEGDAIVINDEIFVTFIGLNKWGGFNIGIDAPKNTTIDRLEMYQSKMRDKETNKLSPDSGDKPVNNPNKEQ